MISGVGVHRIATINGQPFSQGESHQLTVGAAKTTVQCTDIGDESVVVKCSGDPYAHEVRIGRPLTLN